MKKISDEQKINEAVRQLKLSSSFSTAPLQFEIRIYDKGEQIVSPITPLNHFIFVISGLIRVYQLDKDSTIHSIINLSHGEILGYNEFCFNNNDYTLGNPFTVEEIFS